MTYEEAYYHKIMLEIGLTDKFDEAFDNMLEHEDPLSDLALSLTTCGGDRNRQIHSLNDFIQDIAHDQLDRKAVFSFVADHFRSIYESDPSQLEQITKWMYSVAWSSGWGDEDPWNTMYLINDYYNDVSIGLISKESFTECFVQMIKNKKCIDPYIKNQTHNTHGVFERIKTFLNLK